MPRKPPNETRHTPVRKCILSGERDDRSALIRLALGPDGQVAPDIHAKAPGRGAWIGVSLDELTKAQSKGRLKSALHHAFKVKQLSIAEDLAARISAGLEKALLDRLGLEARASNLICGADKVDAAARGGHVALLLHAADASEDGAGKRDQSWRVGSDAEGSGKRGVHLPFDRDALSAALGRNNAVHVAITDKNAAERVMHYLGRWLKFNGCSNGDAKQGSGIINSDETNPSSE
ncbi:MAG: DUF448 domain-containing protein [Sphingorhabdus sp.]